MKIRDNFDHGYLFGALSVGIIVVSFGIAYKYMLDREPVKEVKKYCVINSNGWSHVYPVNNVNVKIEYEEVE
jgi:hypothetical protein